MKNLPPAPGGTVCVTHPIGAPYVGVLVAVYGVLADVRGVDGVVRCVYARDVRAV